MLPALAADQLHVLVFGPGTGELVAVRAPPGKWLVVDGCAVGTRRYALALLDHYQAQPSLAALTHPHLDHASGFAEVVHRATHGRPPSDWPRIGLVWPSPRRVGRWSDLQEHFEAGQVERALAAIEDTWLRAPHTEWRLLAGQAAPLGEAVVKAISPGKAAAAAAFRAWRDGLAWDANRIATAFEVRWGDVRVLLGSDLVEKPGKGWSDVARRFDPGHDATKVPHHGSRGAIHAFWADRAGARTCTLVVTPFARQALPRFDAKGGVAQMLLSAPEVHLTGLPRRHDAQAARPLRRTRKQLELLDRAVLDPASPGWPDCYVVVSVAATGATQLTHGPGSVVVTR